MVRFGQGVYGPAGKVDLADRMAAWTPALPPGGMFTGLTACQAYGLWLPPVALDGPLHVASPVAGAGSRHAGISVSRVVGLPRAWRWGEIPIAPIEEALLGAAARMAVLDCVVLIDSATGAGRTSLTALADYAKRRRRGAPRLRTAIGLADARSESPWESLLRILHLSAGIPVTPQVDVSDARGSFLGRADLLVDGTKTLQEYDGKHHREPGQYRSDRRRDRDLAAAGYVRAGWTAADIATSPGQILTFAQKARGLPFDRRHMATWNGLWRASSFSRPETGDSWAALPDAEAQK